ncbi:MAG: DUF2294 domain-containing protein [Planctomycetia bacterium]|nr:DUF2294 domain-containing protein [Planctomycetia bacterium]
MASSPVTAAVAEGNGNGNGNGDGQSHASGNGNGNGHGGDNGNGRALLKQVRAHMVATGRPRLQEIVETATAVALVSVHHDISTLTGEEVIVFSLKEPPACRAKRKP